MKPSEKILSVAAGLSLAITIGAHAATNSLDWTFSSAGNPSPIDLSGTTNTSGGNPTATLIGANNSYFFGTAPGGASGYFGAPRGLWDVNNGQLDLKLQPTAFTVAEYTLTITHFVDNQVYPGIVNFSVPNDEFVGRNVVLPQSGNMGGFWASDTYSWTNVNLVDGIVSMVISPPSGASALLLDEVRFTINAVPEPSVVQMAATGLLALGMFSWFRNKGNR